MKTGIAIINVEQNQDELKNLRAISETDVSLLLTKCRQKWHSWGNHHRLNPKKKKIPSPKNRIDPLEEWFRRDIDSGTTNNKNKNMGQW